MSTFALTVLAALAAAGPKTPEPFEAFALGVARGLEEGRAEAFPIDLDVLAERITDGVPAPAKLREGFVAGMKRAGPDFLGKELVRSVSRGGAARILRVSGGKGEGRALLRVTGEEGLRYFDLHLRRARAGEVKIVDVFVFTAGEDLSQSMRKLYLMVAADADVGLLDRLMGKEREILAHAKALKAMNDARREGRHADFLALYDELPAALKAERVFLLARIAAASALGDEKRWLRAIEDFERALPGDPTLDLVSVDGFLLRKEYDKALASADRLDARVADPYLEFWRGSILLMKGDRQGAKRRLRAAIAREPTLADPYWTLIDLAQQDGEFAAVAELLTAVERDAGVELRDLEEVPEFAAFVRSKEYPAWKKRSSKRAR